MTAQDLPRQLLSLSRLAQLELDLRSADTAAAIAFIAVNDSHRVVKFDHALAWDAARGAITAVSGGVRIDRTAPEIAWFRRLASFVGSAGDLQSPRRIERSSLSGGLATDWQRWVVGDLVWVPFREPRGDLAGGLFLIRSTPFGDADLRVLARIGGACGQALAALRAPRPLRRRLPRLLTAIGCGAIVGALALVPVPLTVLAEARVAAAEPYVVAAPLDGVVQAIEVAPNASVTAGALLFRMEPVELEAARSLALKRVEVLSAERLTYEQKAFLEPEARAELGLANARLAEGEAELAYAESRLARALVRAPVGGVVVYDDTVSWHGRPVRVGERILVLADPDRTRIEIDVPVEDAVVVAPGSEVRLYLATAPATGIAATLNKVGYEARPSPSGAAAFLAHADFAAGGERPRLGLTGTARITGEVVPLYYALLRKPLAGLRRLTGL